jgi:hypothetical protein
MIPEFPWLIVAYLMGCENLFWRKVYEILSCQGLFLNLYLPIYRFQETLQYCVWNKDDERINVNSPP